MVRVDRFLTLSFFKYISRLKHNNRFHIPILMYHSITCDDEHVIHPYYRVTTTPDAFYQQMAHLAEQGYRTIGLDEAVKLLRKDGNEHKSTLNRLVVITFDDGFLDFYNEAFPVLSLHGFTATVFLPTAFIDTDNSMTTIGKAFLSWDQIRELANAGITFGSHSVSHTMLVKMTQAEVIQELLHSKRTIEEKIGKAVRAFSYPYAFPENNKSFVSFLRSSLQACGYSCA
jgi:peptidoglycan/xylan/chitin deacetylase (PgdA/CDA1 family)